MKDLVLLTLKLLSPVKHLLPLYGGHTDFIKDRFNGWLIDESTYSLSALLRTLAL